MDASAPWVARLAVRFGEPAACTHPWSAWGHVVLELEDAKRYSMCASALVPQGPRRTATVRMATAPGGPAGRRKNAAHLLLADPAQAPGTAADVMLAPGWPGSARAELLSPTSLALSSLDLGAFALEVPVGGLYDRAVLLRDAEPGPALAALSWLREDLDATERGWLTSALEDGPPPATSPPPLPEGVLQLVEERARDHVAGEWAALVRFVRAGPTRVSLPDAEARWALTGRSGPSGAGPARGRVHSVLRGDPADAAVGAWILYELARQAELAPTLARSAAGIQVSAGRTTIQFGRCGGRFLTPAEGAAPPIGALDLRDEAVSAVIAEHLRAGLLQDAVELAAALPAPRPTLEALMTLLAATPIQAAPALHAPELVPGRGRTRSRRLAASWAPAATLPLAAPVDPGDRALLAWWAADREPELARRLAATPTTGAWEQVRQSALARLGEPGSKAAAPWSRGCTPAAHPWPPEG
ncbi:MAG: hypothetical protein EXR71_17600 [Myxococcales bacterium]|nr:hypothetical protein [Myxococcales bacterium]